MSKGKNLDNHLKTTSLQKLVFVILFLVGAITFYSLATQGIKYFVIQTLKGKVHDTTGEIVTLSFEDDKMKDRLVEEYKPYQENDKPKKFETISALNNWAIDVYIGQPNQTRFWLSPIFSLFAFVMFFGIFFAIFFSTVLPSEYGYFRQKIEREIINSLDKIHYIRYGEYLHSEPEGIREEMKNADLQDLYKLSAELNMNIDDLKTLKNAVSWKESSSLQKLLHPIDGLNLYLRNHFTEKYSNSILAFVYIGAAFLIIIVGMRGLKFIPASQPSLVFFALGLEFSILITYALTLMFSKPEEQSPVGEGAGSTDKLITSDKQMEKLLRSFINWKQKD